MALSDEDKLRLNVLSAQPLRAIRINESSMTLHALTDRGEATITLTPTTAPASYLKQVREFLSETHLGITGGYPGHIARWTRLGAVHSRLDKMLLLGDDEAVAAVAASAELSPGIAGAVWWYQQSSDVARKLLAHARVAADPLGAALVQYLLEFLPFEERAPDVVESVRLVLEAGRVDAATLRALWQRAERRNPVLVGFLLAGPAHLPALDVDSPLLPMAQAALGTLAPGDDLHAQLLRRFLHAPGRTWLRALQGALRKPGEQDVVVRIFDAIHRQVTLPGTQPGGVRELCAAQQLVADARAGTSPHPDLDRLLAALPPPLADKLAAIALLGQLGESTLTPVFGGRDFSGSVMRKHLAPLTDAITGCIQTLLCD